MKKNYELKSKLDFNNHQWKRNSGLFLCWFLCIFMYFIILIASILVLNVDDLNNISPTYEGFNNLSINIFIKVILIIYFIFVFLISISIITTSTSDLIIKKVYSNINIDEIPDMPPLEI